MKGFESYPVTYQSDVFSLGKSAAYFLSEMHASMDYGDDKRNATLFFKDMKSCKREFIKLDQKYNSPIFYYLNATLRTNTTERITIEHLNRKFEEQNFFFNRTLLKEIIEKSERKFKQRNIKDVHCNRQKRDVLKDYQHFLINLPSQIQNNYEHSLLEMSNTLLLKGQGVENNIIKSVNKTEKDLSYDDNSYGGCHDEPQDIGKVNAAEVNSTQSNLNANHNNSSLCKPKTMLLERR